VTHDPVGVRARAQALLAKITPGTWTAEMPGRNDAHMCRVMTDYDPQAKDRGVGGARLLIGMTWHPEHIVSYVGLTREECMANAALFAAAPQLVRDLLALLTSPVPGAWQPMEPEGRKSSPARGQHESHATDNIDAGHSPVTRPTASDDQVSNRTAMPPCATCGHNWGDHAMAEHMDYDIDDGKRPCHVFRDDGRLCNCPNYVAAA
jgi:hypothetical protein